MREFKGRVVTPGTVTAEALVTTEGFNTLASFQNALQFGDKEVKCGGQNNKDLHGKSMLGKSFEILRSHKMEISLTCLKISSMKFIGN